MTIILWLIGILLALIAIVLPIPVGIRWHREKNEKSRWRISFLFVSIGSDGFRIFKKRFPFRKSKENNVEKIAKEKSAEIIGKNAKTAMADEAETKKKKAGKIPANKVRFCRYEILSRPSQTCNRCSVARSEIFNRYCRRVSNFQKQHSGLCRSRKSVSPRYRLRCSISCCGIYPEEIKFFIHSRFFICGKYFKNIRQIFCKNACI